MKHAIKLAEEVDAQGFYFLMTTGVGMALPGNTYIVDEGQLLLLQKHGISYTEIAHEQSAPVLVESATIERI
jgi:hypothetical protein